MRTSKFKLYMEPQSILEKVNAQFGNTFSEMSGFQTGFLCELIRKKRPSKILEIGVSAGGTTAVVLNALDILDLECNMYSVDYSEAFYRDNSRKTGFVSEWVKANLFGNSNSKWRHTMFTGGGICNYLKAIGDRIDFLILDTMHYCPGEILDFLTCYPYMTKGAIVVLHDIGLHYAGHREAYATQLLLDCVTANKIVERDYSDDRYCGFPNIGAFEINDDTGKYIQDVFMALNISWSYIPDELELYRKEYSDSYGQECIELFDMAVNNNKMLYKRQEEKRYEAMSQCMKLIADINRRSVYIYGNGKVGKRLDKLLSKAGVEIKGHVVSEKQSSDEGTLSIHELTLSEDSVIVVGVGNTYRTDIINTLRSKGISDFIIPGDIWG